MNRYPIGLQTPSWHYLEKTLCVSYYHPLPEMKPYHNPKIILPLFLWTIHLPSKSRLQLLEFTVHQQVRTFISKVTSKMPLSATILRMTLSSTYLDHYLSLLLDLDLCLDLQWLPGLLFLLDLLNHSLLQLSITPKKAFNTKHPSRRCLVFQLLKLYASPRTFNRLLLSLGIVSMKLITTRTSLIYTRLLGQLTALLFRYTSTLLPRTLFFQTLPRPGLTSPSPMWTLNGVRSTETIWWRLVCLKLPHLQLLLSVSILRRTLATRHREANLHRRLRQYKRRRLRQYLRLLRLLSASKRHCPMMTLRAQHRLLFPSFLNHRDRLKILLLLQNFRSLLYLEFTYPL